MVFQNLWSKKGFGKSLREDSKNTSQNYYCCPINLVWVLILLHLHPVASSVAQGETEDPLISEKQDLY
jgi:hypothetical protein